MSNYPFVDERLLSQGFAGDAAVRALSAEESRLAAYQAHEEARGVKEIDERLRRFELQPAFDRAKSYAPFSRTTGRVRMISIIPYNGSQRDAKYVGGMGISDGEPASGVVVRMDGTKVAEIHLLDYIGNKVVERKIDPGELSQQSPRHLVEDWKREPTTPNLPSSTSTAVAGHAFRSLLFDDYSALVYTGEEVRSLIYNAPIVSAIAQLQHMRHLGTPTATSCCCCCCCCWGSCSSCSAIASEFVGNVDISWTVQPG